ncbi:MAG: MBL fold metallo-hydrolase [Hyphomicrobiaceae bacterium]
MTDKPEFKTSMIFEYGQPAGMAPGVVRLVANNPGSFTFKGTNTYLVGSTSLAVIDPGPEDEPHLAAILSAAGNRPITHIFITHRHRDHVDGCPALAKATGAITLAAPRPNPPSQSENNPTPSGEGFVAFDFEPDVSLADGDTISGEDWGIEAVTTPGHAPDHLCFALNGQEVLFSGDHVMAWNTTVVAPPEGRMADYMLSLERLQYRKERLYLPGHGGRIEKGRRTTKAYLLHRKWREQAILSLIREEQTTVRDIVGKIYKDLHKDLYTAAALSVRAHVEHLIEKSLVTEDGDDSPVSFDNALFAVSPASCV